MDLFVNPKLSTAEQLRPVDARIGQLLIDSGKLGAGDVKRILALQKEQGLRFGEAALSLRLVDGRDVLRALSVQFEYPYAPADSGLDRALVMALNPFSARAEALRALRSQLLLRWFGGRRRLLAVTAARRGAGCSEVAANLAIGYAQLGEKTLLIDTDMRAPTLCRLFGFKPKRGLSGLLAGRSALAEALEYTDSIGGLAVLCTGAQPPNPQELLSRPAFVGLLTEAAEHYDIVILDTPPALESADAQIVAAVTGGALVVARRNQTRARDLRDIGGQFAPIGVTAVGSVLVD